MASVSSTSSTSSTDYTRMTGLSGLDTESIIQGLMKSERVPLDRLKQKREKAEWTQDAYRDMTALLQGLKSAFLDMANPSTCMLLNSAYKKFTGATSDSTIATVTGNSTSLAGSHTIHVNKIATADKAVSSSAVADPLVSNAAITDFNLSGKTIKITLDNITREITLDNYATGADLQTGIQTLINNAFGAGKISAAFDGGTGKLTLDVTGGASKLTLASGTTNDALSALGFTSGVSNRINTGLSLESASSLFANDLTFNADGKLKFTINSKSFEFDKSTTISSMMSTISSDSTANVNMAYDDTTGKFTLTSKQLGAGDNIVIDAASQEGNFFGAAGASGIVTGSAATVQGADAEVVIDGQTLTRSSNSVYVNGVTYNLLKAQDASDTKDITVSLSADTNSVYNNIKSFVEKYNEVIEKINDKLTEKYDRNYQPLTADQKDTMSEDDITKWETKAKTGLLRNDSILQNALYSMRRALSEPISGVDGTLSSIGITTSTLYAENGKLVIDEEKLKNAISNDPDKVMNMFSQSSSVSWSSSMTAEQKNQRYNEEGLAYRISDILNDNIRATLGKGLLLQKAGITGDSTEYNSLLYDQITDYTDKISDMIEKLEDKEDAYYKKYANLESMLSKMNSQSSWLTSQLSSGG